MQDVKKCSHLAPYLPSQFPACSLPSAAAYPEYLEQERLKGEQRLCWIMHTVGLLNMISGTRSCQILVMWRDQASWLTWGTGNSLSARSAVCIQEGAGAADISTVLCSELPQPSRSPPASSAPDDFCSETHSTTQSLAISLCCCRLYSWFSADLFLFLLCSVSAFFWVSGAVTIATDRACVSLLLPWLSLAWLSVQKNSLLKRLLC